MDKIYCYTVQERLKKTYHIMAAFARGCGGKVIHDETLRDDGIAIIWGQIYCSNRLMKECEAKGIPFFQIDNGYFHAANGNEMSGYYRVTLNKLAKNWIDKRAGDRFREHGIEIRPWKAQPSYDRGLVVLAVPGRNFGVYLGLSMDKWAVDIKGQILSCTNRKVLVRDKTKIPPLVDVLDSSNGYAVVTHSSNAAVEAVIAGYPVFCHELCAAAPVGNGLDFANINNPERPDNREEWANSLAYSQFTLNEMESGLAWSILKEELSAESNLYRV